MKKTFFFLALLLMGAAGWSTLKAQTISKTTITFNYCQETERDPVSVTTFSFPYVYENRLIFNEPGTKTDVTINGGCPEYTEVTVSRTYHLPGKFSVSATKQVYFAPGNLQYFKDDTNGEILYDNGTTIKGFLRFAKNQWVVIPGVKDGWRDLMIFAEAASWFLNSNISNGGTEPWQILSRSDWDYLWNSRKGTDGKTVATSLRGWGTVNSVQGLILLPDNWNDVKPEGITFSTTVAFNANVYDSVTWVTKMEPAGAVFLPAGGSSTTQPTAQVSSGGVGKYWTSTLAGSGKYYYVNINANATYGGPNNNNSQSSASWMSVRYVQTVPAQ